MTDQRVCANGGALTENSFTTQDPYHAAMYLAEMIRAAEILAENHIPDLPDIGLAALLTMAKERANALTIQLDKQGTAKDQKATS